MRFLALACDYDGTLAHHGLVDAATASALERVRESGRKLLLVTGRQLDDLRTVFDRFDLFDCVVVENGALLHWPRTGVERTLGEAPPPGFVEALRRRYVPVSEGRVIVATWEPHEQAVLETIRDLGLELQVIFNKGAVMVLPAGVNKASGLAAALEELGLSAHNVVGIGDAENDHAFLAACECAVAVANALPTIRERADFVTRADHGAGVVELIDELLQTDLADREPLLRRHHLVLGVRATADGGSPEPFAVPPYGTTILVAGSSGGGKSSFATGLLERIVEAGYQCCVVDPEGDHGNLEGAVAIGTPQRAPTDEEVAKLLEDRRTNAVVNLLGERFADRPAAFARLAGRLRDLRGRFGRPHWIVVDEAHHVAPSSSDLVATVGPEVSCGLVLITVDPRSLSAALLEAVNVVVTVGEGASSTMIELTGVLGRAMPEPPATPAGQVLAWNRGGADPPLPLLVLPGRTERERHVRKYAEGELGPERSFYFRGPQDRLNLRAQNLILFNQIAEGVDDATWIHHLRRGDYSRWFRDQIKDEELAAEAAGVEAVDGISAGESRALIRDAIERRYTVPA